MVGWQPTELRSAISVVAQEPAHGWCALRGRLRVVESLDHGRKGVCLSDPTVQVDGIPTSVFLDRLGVLMDRVGSQVLQFRATGVQHRDPSAATTVGCVGALRIARIHASLPAEQRYQASVQEGEAHAFAAVDKQQLSKLAILLVIQRHSRLPALGSPARDRVGSVFGDPDPTRSAIF